MGNSTNPLTNTEVSHAKPKPKEYNLADGKGLFLRVKPNGSKLWLFNYFKPFTDRRSNIGLGVYPSVSLQQARETRAHYLKLIADGVDPKEHRETEERKLRTATQNTLESAARKWLKLKSATVSESYLDRITEALELYVFPSLGEKPISKLTAPEAIELLEPLAEKGILETVKKLCRWLNEIMTYCVNTGLVFSNPLVGIGKAFPNPQSESMPTIHPDELPGFMKRLFNSTSITPNTRRLILFQLQTMVRPGEAAGAAWNEIDEPKALWEIPLDRMKKRRIHKVPLSTQAMSVLREMGELGGNNQYIFPSSKYAEHHVHSETANKALRRIGMTGELVAHGMRSLASTVLNERGFDPELIEISLAHVNKDRMRAAYNKAEYLEKRRELLQWWSDYLDVAVNEGLKAD